MRTRLLRYSVVAATSAGVLFLLLLSMSAAQNQTPATRPDARPTPRLANGHPNMSGFYNGDNYHGDLIDEPPGEHVINRTGDGNIFFDYAGANYYAGENAQSANQPPYKPEYMAKAKAIGDTSYGIITSLDPSIDCKPAGVPRASVGIMHIVQNEQYVALLYEAAPGPVYRIIYTDGRTHPTDLDTSYFGHSIGRWDGDTLVVDVVGLNDETWLNTGAGGTKLTSIHSDKEHVIERWTRKGDDLTYEATVEDPVMFTKPWVINPRHAQIARSDDYIQPQMCASNDKGHLIQPSDKDRFVCGWCQKDPDAVYGQGAAAASPKPAAGRAGGE